MGIPVCVVDAFAERPFQGNPAAVCFLQAAANPSWMQRFAGEMNLSETSFVVPRADGGWDLRWFTPTTEVQLCGHATLAAAHALWSEGRARRDLPVRFSTRSGWLTCHLEGTVIRMDFPARPAEVASIPTGLPEALGADIRWCGRSADDFLVELPHAASVRSMQPDLAAVALLPARGVIATAPSDDPGFDFISRFFAPGAGVPEDPVTGSAHCTLAGYWAQRLGKFRLRGWQASRRGGIVGAELAGDRVLLRGGAITTLRGEWILGLDAEH